MRPPLEDIFEITQLKARYADAVDGGWTGVTPHDPDAVVALFVEDGVWDSGVFGGGEGHQGIRDFMATGADIMPFAFHHITSPRIEVDGDSARGRWHAVLAVTTEGPGKLQVGIYDDRFVRTDAGWRFARLGFTLAASANLGSEWQLF